MINLKLIEILENLSSLLKKLNKPNDILDDSFISEISKFEILILNYITLVEMTENSEKIVEKTPRQLLKETLEKNSKEWNACPEWVRKAISTDLFFNVRKPND